MKSLGIIGLGNMGTALLSGLVSNGMDSSGIVGVEAWEERAKEVRDKFGIEVVADASRLPEVRTVLLAVKPGDVQKALGDMGELSGKLLISICAGVTLDWFTFRLGEDAAIVRVMPNTPALVGEGASVYCTSAGVNASQIEEVEKILGAVGTVFRVDNEKLMDAVTGLSGSGPAFVFQFLEALADGGVAAGLPRELSRQLAIQTVYGSAKMALKEEAHLGELKDRVCSPGGTTIEGVRQLEKSGLRSAVIEAVLAATKRSRELGGN